MFVAQSSACCASFWIWTSIVSSSESPATGCWSIETVRVTRPGASRSTCSLPYVPRRSLSKVASTPALPIWSSFR